MGRVLLILATIAGLVAISPDAGAGDQSAASESFFELKVRPVLAGTCVKCHGEKKASGGLRLDSRDAMIAGGDGGPAVVPGDPEAQPSGPGGPPRRRHAQDAPEQAAVSRIQNALSAWVAAGAPGQSRDGSKPIQGQSHWAFEPLRTDHGARRPDRLGLPADRPLGRRRSQVPWAAPRTQGRPSHTSFAVRIST